MNNATDSPSLEKLFENATEDISTYNWAVELWPERGEEYSSGHLLITAVSSRARGLLALERIAAEELSEDYKSYQAKLQHMLDKTETVFEQLVASHTKELQSLFQESGELWDRLSSLDLQLKHVRHIAEDGMLLQDEEWESDDLREAIHDFLLYFSDIHYLAHDPPKGLAAFAAFTMWGQEFKNVEKQFHDWFGYFAPASDLLKVLSQREYEPEFWWFTETPTPDKVTGTELTDEQVQALGRLLDIAPSETCPDQELVIAYAMDELSGQKRLDVQSHVNKCPLCTGHVLDVRFAVAQGEARKGEPVAPGVPEQVEHMPSYLQEVVNKAFPEAVFTPGSPEEVVCPSPQDYDRCLETLKRHAPHLIISVPESFDKKEPEKMPDIPRFIMGAEYDSRQMELHFYSGEEKSIPAHLLRMTHDAVKDVKIIKVRITHEQFRQDMLTVSGEIADPGSVPPDATWQCCWLTGKKNLIEPEKFKVDKAEGFFVATFDLSEGKEGELRIVFICPPPSV